MFCGFCRDPGPGPIAFENPPHACLANDECTTAPYTTCEQRSDGVRRVFLVHAELGRLARHVHPEAARERCRGNAEQHGLDATRVLRNRVQLLRFAHRFEHELRDACGNRIGELPGTFSGPRKTDPFAGPAGG